MTTTTFVDFVTPVPASWLNDVDEATYVTVPANTAAAAAAQATADNHIADTVDAHAASAITNTPAGSIAATTVQAAVNELDTDVQGHITDTTAAHAASAITNTPAGSIAATDVQAAINELDTEKAALGVTAGKAVQTDQTVTAWTRAATTTLGTSLNGTLSDTSTTITAFNGVAGVTYHVRALGAGSITHHATDLIITQGLASITTAAGDTFDVEMLTATTCRIKNYVKATVERKVVQIVTTQVGTVATGTTQTPADNTIPQITEGDQYMSLAITPTNASSTLEVEVLTVFANSLATVVTTALHQDSTANALAAAAISTVTANAIFFCTFKHVVTAGTTSSTTFKVRMGPSGASTVTFNGASATQYMGGVMPSRITIKEYLP